ncbi:zinc-finger domain-containing protein [Pseudoroseicyclus sp. CXY001]|uniref:zinc-finger domain-containing protein n=1 Tax=Pseudoroseicyclus sp. CXY001 TaxID=3242492 RepID=UPI0035715964
MRPQASAYPAPETRTTHARRFACDGGEGALGHPRVWLTIPLGAASVDCPYCDARWVLEGDGADHH